MRTRNTSETKLISSETKLVFSLPVKNTETAKDYKSFLNVLIKITGEQFPWQNIQSKDKDVKVKK